MFLMLIAMAGAHDVLLDLGGQHSAVLPGFERVTRDGGVDAAWSIVPNTSSSVVFPDALSDSVIAGSLSVGGDGGWMAVRVAAYSPGPGGRRGAGTWTVRIDNRPVYQADIPSNIGPFLQSRHYMPVWRPEFVAGESAWERLLVHQHPWIVVPVPASGPVEVSVIGRNWEAVIRADTEAQVRAYIAQADAAARADYLAHADTTARAELPVGGEGVELAGWGVLPSPERAGHTGAWEMQGARTEVLGGVVWLHGVDGPVDVDLAAMPFVEAQTTEAVWFDTRGRPAVLAQPQPAVLEPIEDTLTGGQGVPVGLGVTLRVAADAPTGLHRGEITLSAQGASWVVPIELQVMPFELDRTRPTGPFMSMNLFHGRWHGVDSPRSLAYIDAAMDLLSFRGLDAIGLQNSMFGLSDGGVDLSVTEHVMDGWEARGGRWFHWTDVKRDLRNDAMYDGDGVVLSATRQARTAEMLRGISGRRIPVSVALTEEEGWKSTEAIRRAQDYFSLVRGFTPDDVMLTGHVGHALGWTLAPQMDAMMWSGHPGQTWEWADRATGNGETPLIAYNFGSGRGAPLRSWHLGAVAHLEWQFADEPIDPFASLETNRTVTMSVLSPAGVPWSTPWLERFARGVQDARYIVTLDRWVQEARCDAPVVDEARRWLDGLHEALEVTRGRAEHGGDIWSEQAFDDVQETTRSYLLRVGRRCGMLSGPAPVPDRGFDRARAPRP